MIRLQTYFMIGLHAPNLVWNAVIHTWPWLQQLQQDAMEAGFNLESKYMALTSLRDPDVIFKSAHYRLEMVKRVFSGIDGGFSIEDALEFFDAEVGLWTDYRESHWFVQDNRYFYNKEEVSIKEWHNQYRKKTKEHVEIFL